ncbi:MAG: F0F1 ATP synthase subunit epsilon [Candidatus Aminicenantes bacterium]|nr:F0F1 ATP synthase subunit epsilon [Candidatus Aminicenantes bacterium]
MADTIELEIISFREISLRSEIRDLYIPVFFGEAGIKSHHLPYLALLKAGEISYLDLDGVRHYLYSGEGFMEVNDDRITLIIDAFERGENFREADLQEQLSDSEKKVKSPPQGALAALELQQELDRQKELRIKLEICKKQGKK